MSFLNPTEPLGLPRGSVRAILAILIVGSTILFQGIALATGAALDPLMVGLAGAVVGYYFAERSFQTASDPVEPPLAAPYVDGDGE